MRSIPPAIASSRTLTGITAALVLAAFMTDWLQIAWVVSLIKVALAAMIVAALLPFASRKQ